MNKKLIFLSALSMVGSLAAFAPCAKADDIDEKQHKLQARINVAIQKKRLNGKDATEIKSDMKVFSEALKTVRQDHSDVLSAEDSTRLDKQLNAINQKFELKRKPAK